MWVALAVGGFAVDVWAPVGEVGGGRVWGHFGMIWKDLAWVTPDLHD